MSISNAIVLLATSIAPIQGTDGHLENAHVHVMGSYCSPVGCSSNPRELADDVHFDLVRSNLNIADVDRLEMNWGVILNCAVKRNLLKNCRPEGELGGLQKARSTALKIVKSLRIGPAPKPSGDAGTRALIFVNYEYGPCASWRCSPTPAPPAPPALPPR